MKGTETMKGTEENEYLGYLPPRFSRKGFDVDLYDLNREENYDSYLDIISRLYSCGIKTTRDVCRLDMSDLVVITGMTRYQLYDFVSMLGRWGFHLGQSRDEMIQTYYYWRREKQQNDAIYERLEQLQAAGEADAETIVLKEIKDGRIPISEESEKVFNEDYETFSEDEYHDHDEGKRMVSIITIVR